MDPSDVIAGYAAIEPRRQNVHDMIRDWHYLAARKMAADDHYAQLIAEAAQSRFPTANAAAVGWSDLIDRARQRVGAVLVATGARIQGRSPTIQTAAAPDA